MDELSDRLRAAHSDATPGRDLWPEVAERIAAPRTTRWQQAAAAVLLFGAGALTGALVRGNPPTEPFAATADSPLHAAAAVQRAGSDYLAAVAQLREIGAADETLRTQGYEAALNVLSVSAEEVMAALELDDRDAFVIQARDVRAVASQRVRVLLQGGGE